jgi:hypothetical protein
MTQFAMRERMMKLGVREIAVVDEDRQRSVLVW